MVQAFSAWPLHITSSGDIGGPGDIPDSPLPDRLREAGTATGPYLRDAGVQHGAEERLAVVGADGGGQEGQQVVLKEALTEELVEQPAGVEGSQRTLEPGVLDGHVHVCFSCRERRQATSRAGASGQRSEELGAGPAYIRPDRMGALRAFSENA